MNPTCIIADDEPLLVAALKSELSQLWPQLTVLKTVGNGNAALAAIQELEPDIAFLDIRMPGLTGIEVAQAAFEDTEHLKTQLVFVTAYDEYATAAFESAAVDYVLKPANSTRLSKTVERLKRRLPGNSANQESPQDLVMQLRKLLDLAPENRIKRETLKHLRIGVGEVVKMVPLQDVLYLQASDKYVVIVTNDAEHLIREPLKDLLPQLDPEQFVQIHRSTVVNINKVERVERDELGKQTILLRDQALAKHHAAKQRLVVSRLYSHLFKAM
jgi:DNA-binding LytR/AlgR family response regulator